MTRDLLAGADIARLAGVSRQRAHTLTRTPAFPAPVAETTLGRFWRRADVEAFLGSWQRRPGRPPKPEAELSERVRKARQRNAERANG